MGADMIAIVGHDYSAETLGNLKDDLESPASSELQTLLAESLLRSPLNQNETWMWNWLHHPRDIIVGERKPFRIDKRFYKPTLDVDPKTTHWDKGYVIFLFGPHVHLAIGPRALAISNGHSTQLFCSDRDMQMWWRSLYRAFARCLRQQFFLCHDDSRYEHNIEAVVKGYTIEEILVISKGNRGEPVTLDSETLYDCPQNKWTKQHETPYFVEILG
jgi:hypothetical protein